VQVAARRDEWEGPVKDFASGFSPLDWFGKGRFLEDTVLIVR